MSRRDGYRVGALQPEKDLGLRMKEINCEGGMRMSAGRDRAHPPILEGDLGTMIFKLAI